MSNVNIANPTIDILAQNWWIILWRGIAALIFGLLTWFNPVITLYVMLLFFGGYAFVDGVLGIIMAIKTRHSHQDWWFLLISAIANLVVGIAVFVMPVISVVVLIYFLAIWAVATGLLQIIVAIGLRKVIKGEGWIILGGILSIIFGVILFMNPIQGGIAITWLMGIYAVVFGIINIVLAFSVRRSLHK